jgi:hypothetical protein
LSSFFRPFFTYFPVLLKNPAVVAAFFIMDPSGFFAYAKHEVLESRRRGLPERDLALVFGGKVLVKKVWKLLV